MCSSDLYTYYFDDARAAAVPVWLVPYGYNMGQPILASEPDSLISDFSCLL